MLKKILRFKKNSSEKENDFTQPNALSEQINDANVELGLPLESSSKKDNMTKIIVLGAGLIGVGITVAGIIAFSGSSNDEEIHVQQQELEKIAISQTKDFSTEKLDFGQEETNNDTEIIADSEDIQPETIETAEYIPPPTSYESHETYEPHDYSSTNHEIPESPEDRKKRGNIVVFSGNSQTNQLKTSSNDSSRETSETSFSSKLKPTYTPSVQAELRADLTYLLAKGTNIPCTLDTQIITTHSGITRCLVTKDVYSANGKVLLLERGTKIIGEQNSAMLQGQARVFIIWNEAETPKGVKVSLASGGAGQLGASGHDARVNYHFWQRFGGAVMISLIGDLGDYYSNRSKSNGQNITFENSSDAAQEMATEALRNSINIPPTGFINHGSLINIMVARDVDFSSVYEVVKTYELF